MSGALPATIGRYQIVSTIGRGAMGVIYKGHDPDIGRDVAIKLIRADLLASDEQPEFIARFRQEAQAAGRCLHPNIVTIYEYALHEGNPYIAMEYVAGASLAAAARQKGRFEPAVAAGLGLQILRALACAHALGVVHRDIKPANVLLRSDGQLKVVDFGVARLESANLTQGPAMIGTASYMAPEQCTGGQVDARSDLFAVGVVLWEMLTGEKPFPGASVGEIIGNLLQREPPDLRDRLPSENWALADVVTRALRKLPDQRFPSAAAMIAALEAARPSLDVSDSELTRLMPRSAPVPAHATPAMSFDSAVLDTVRARLAEQLGPIAQVLLREAVPKAPDLDSLCRSLASKIPTASGRDEFMSKVSADVLERPATTIGAPVRTTLTPSAVVPARSSAGLSPATLDLARDALTHFLGPIARVLVKRAAERAPTVDALWDALAGHLENERERQSFLAKRPR